MPKIKKIAPFTYIYKCECGKKITLFTDEKPKRLTKCFDCLNKMEDLG
jgi:hypothetical protein